MNHKLYFNQRAYCNTASDARWKRRHPGKSLELREHRNYGSDCELIKPGSISPTWSKLEMYRHFTSKIE